MKSIKAQPVANEQEEHDAAGNADRQPQHIDEGVALIFPEVAYRGFVKHLF
jgi:hypothetical protein